MRQSSPDTGNIPRNGFCEELRTYLETPFKKQHKLFFEPGESREMERKNPELIRKLTSLWLKNTSILTAAYGDKVDVLIIGKMIETILSGWCLGREDIRRIHMLLQGEAGFYTYNLFSRTPELQRVLDYAEKQAMRLLEKWIHDTDTPGSMVPDFEPIRGRVERLHVSHKYGGLVWYVQQIGSPDDVWSCNSEYIYTDSYVLDWQGNPLFRLDENILEWFDYSCSGYVGNNVFLVSHTDKEGLCKYRIRDLQGNILERFEGKNVLNFGNGILFPSKDDRGNGTGGLYDTKSNTWILQGEYAFFEIEGNSCRLKSQETGKYGIFDLVNKQWGVECKEPGIIPVTGSKGEEWCIKNEDGTYRITDSHGGIICTIPHIESEELYTESEELSWARLLLESEKGSCKYLLAMGPALQYSTCYILTADGENIIGPLGVPLQENTTEAIFRKKGKGWTYTRIDRISGRSTDTRIPGNLISWVKENDVRCISFESEGNTFGVKDLEGNILVAPQAHVIETYIPESGLLHVSREVPYGSTSKMVKEYQLLDKNGNIILPWIMRMTCIRYADSGVYYTDTGKLVYMTDSGEALIRDIPSGWVTVKKTAKRWTYIIDDDQDRGWHLFTLFNALDNTVFTWGKWIPWNHTDHGASGDHSIRSTPELLKNGYILHENWVIDANGDVIVSWPPDMKTSLLYEGDKEIWVMCRYRNSLMKIMW